MNLFWIEDSSFDSSRLICDLKIKRQQYAFGCDSHNWGFREDYAECIAYLTHLDNPGVWAISVILCFDSRS